jgi:hypothetical protein
LHRLVLTQPAAELLPGKDLLQLSNK